MCVDDTECSKQENECGSSPPRRASLVSTQDEKSTQGMPPAERSSHAGKVGKRTTTCATADVGETDSQRVVSGGSSQEVAEGKRQGGDKGDQDNCSEMLLQMTSARPTRSTTMYSIQFRPYTLTSTPILSPCAAAITNRNWIRRAR